MQLFPVHLKPVHDDVTLYLPEPPKVTIVVMSRLVYRKGADLIAALIPAVCLKHQDVDFIIGEDSTLCWGGINLCVPRYDTATPLLISLCLLCIGCTFNSPLPVGITVYTHPYVHALLLFLCMPTVFTHITLTLCNHSIASQTAALPPLLDYSISKQVTLPTDDVIQKNGGKVVVWLARLDAKVQFWLFHNAGKLQ